MKKRTIAVLFTGALLALTLCACGTEGGNTDTSTDNPGTSDSTGTTASALASITNKDKNPLSLGMTREEVEAVLPAVAGSEMEAMGTTYSYFGSEPENEVYVGFMDGVVNTLSIGGSSNQQPLESSNWSLKGISLGDKRSDVIKALGEPSTENPLTTNGADGSTTVAENQVTLQYYFDADEKLLTGENPPGARMVLGILLDGDTVKSFGTFTLVQSGTPSSSPEAAE